MDCLWPAFAKPAKLQDRELHIWCANLEPAQDHLAVLKKTLTGSEEQRAARFHFRQHRHRFIAARGLLRLLLGFYLNKRPNEIVISYSEHGKPFLSSKRVFFNLSHSEESVLFAFSLTSEIGIDLEQIRPINDAEGIAARFFSTGEYDRFQQLPEEEKNEAFFTCWTLKEAFIKAVGEGLSYRLSDFDVSFSPGQKVGLNTINGCAREASQWSLISLSPMTGYTGALAVKGQGWQLSQRQLVPTF